VRELVTSLLSKQCYVANPLIFKTAETNNCQLGSAEMLKIKPIYGKRSSTDLGFKVRSCELIQISKPIPNNY